MKEAVAFEPVILLPPPEPVFTVIGNVLPSPLVKVIVFNTTEAVVNRLDVLTVPPLPAFKAYDAVKAKEDVPAN